MRNRFTRALLSAGVMTLSLAASAQALPFTISANLTGDYRWLNPDDILLNVTVTGDTTSNTTTWLVDINSPAHPDARLDVFAFNLLLAPSQTVSFSTFSPASWSISAPGNNVPGSGSADFLFEANDPPGNGNNVTNTVNLSFQATLNTGTWSSLNLLDAALSQGGGIPGAGAQLGAHVRSLSTSNCSSCSDSGFASGNYSTPSASVPEPTSLLLMGLGVAGAGLIRRRR